MKIVEARIEIPMGSQNKYEIDTRTGKIKLDRVLFSASHYPAEYGYIENTLSEDGDALDILVFTSVPTFPGCYIEARIIGGMDMIDNNEGDIKILAVNNKDPRFGSVSKIEDINSHVLKEIENFFGTYKALQNTVTKVNGFFDEEQAIIILNESYARYNKINK